MFSFSDDPNPFALSRRLEKLAHHCRSFRQELVLRKPSGHPFKGEAFPGLSLYQEVSELDESDPLRAPTLRWIHRLTEERVNLPWQIEEADLLYRSSLPAPLVKEGRASFHELGWGALLAGANQRESHWSNLARVEGAVSAHRVGLLARRVEISARLGVPSRSEYFQAIAPTKKGEEALSLTSLARLILTESSDAARAAWGDGWSAHAHALLAPQATEGWPARLAEDTLSALFEGAELFRGASGPRQPLPPRLAPVSFLRAMQQRGRDWAMNHRPQDLPFVLARDPDALLEHQSGALFALWGSSETFQRRTLSLSRDSALRSQKSLNLSLLAHLRLMAVRVLLDCAANSGEKALREAWSEVSALLVFEELPQTALLSRFQVRADEGARLVGFLHAALDEREMIERFDEDWLRNPRAVEKMRDEIVRPAFTQHQGRVLREALSIIVARLTAHLD